MTAHSLAKTYRFAPLIFLPEISKIMLEKLAENLAENQTWIKTIPFGWMTAAIAAFFIGALVQDILNPRSLLRAWLRERGKVFDVVTLIGTWVPGPPYRVDINCAIKLRKNINNKHLSIRYIFPLPGRPPMTGPIRYEKLESVPKDQIIRFRLGSIRPSQPSLPGAESLAAPPSLWGEKLEEELDAKAQRTHIMGGRQLIVIEIGAQRYEAYFHVLSSISHGKENEYVHMLREDEFPFID